MAKKTPEGPRAVKSTTDPKPRGATPVEATGVKAPSWDELISEIPPTLRESATKLRDAVVVVYLARSRSKEKDADDENVVSAARSEAKTLHQDFLEIAHQTGWAPKKEMLTDAVDLAAYKIAYDRLADDFRDAMKKEVVEEKQARTYAEPAQKALQRLESNFKKFFPEVENGSRKVRQEVFNDMEEEILKGVDASLRGYIHPDSFIALSNREKAIVEKLSNLLWWYEDGERLDPKLPRIARRRIQSRKKIVQESVTSNTIASIQQAIDADPGITKESYRLDALKENALRRLEQVYYWRFAGDKDAIKNGRREIRKLENVLRQELDAAFRTKTELAPRNTVGELRTEPHPMTAIDEFYTGGSPRDLAGTLDGEVRDEEEINGEIFAALEGFRKKISHIDIDELTDLHNALSQIKSAVSTDLGEDSAPELENTLEWRQACQLRDRIQEPGAKKVRFQDAQSALRFVQDAAMDVAYEYSNAVVEGPKEPSGDRPPTPPEPGPGVPQGPIVTATEAAAQELVRVAGDESRNIVGNRGHKNDDMTALVVDIIEKSAPPTPETGDEPLEYQPVYDKFYGKFLREWMKAMNVRIGADGKPELSDGIEYPAFATLRPKARLAFAENYAENATERILEKMGLEKVKKGPQVETKHAWEAPSLEELKESQNTFADNKTVVMNLFRLLILTRMRDKSADFQVLQAKDFLLLPRLSDEKLPEYLSSPEDISTLFDYNDKISSQEFQRQKNAHRALNEIQAPYRESTWGGGTYFSNRFNAPEKPKMKLEKLEYRINLALTEGVSGIRVLADLYETLCKNKTLAIYGFETKSLSSHRTDAVIVYCGEQALNAALTEVGNYCIKEDIGHDAGVPFGVRPLRHDGQVFDGLTVTSSPGEGYTFNDLQASALRQAYKEYTNAFLKQNGFADETLETAGDAALSSLLEKLQRPDTTLLDDLEDYYAAELQSLCGQVPDLHNLAFPKVQKTE